MSVFLVLYMSFCFFQSIWNTVNAGLCIPQPCPFYLRNVQIVAMWSLHHTIVYSAGCWTSTMHIQNTCGIDKILFDSSDIKVQTCPLPRKKSNQSRPPKVSTSCPTRFFRCFNQHQKTHVQRMLGLWLNISKQCLHIQQHSWRARYDQNLSKWVQRCICLTWTQNGGHLSEMVFTVFTCPFEDTSSLGLTWI